MKQVWWAAGLTVPAAFVVKLLIGGGSRRKPLRQRAKEDQDGSELSFFCERVCTSDRLLRRMGGLSKDPTPGTCVTVCGVSDADACTDACQRAVCINMHQVPAWNEACVTRCTNECLRGRTHL
ncbi:unnamed protein product [Ostreobium quekettii]|uniref:Uncharacterized protein n=1 Tax=Ostreobium quekettii TaxID=121088 RepID=A0A8S1ITE5_9CHLO|nr:unnamed protein product [Ostreobium quekettii]